MIDPYFRLELWIRNKRWGTCGACPRDETGMPYPERCIFTDRYDHHLALTTEDIAEEALRRIRAGKLTPAWRSGNIKTCGGRR